MKVSRGNVHEFLGMTLDYQTSGIVTISMKDYIKNIIDEYPDSRKYKKVESPSSSVLFTTRDEVGLLDPEMKDKFQPYVTKLLYLRKRTRPDIALVISFLTTRVREPNKDDWNKLTRCVTYLHNTKDITLNLNSEQELKITW